MPSSAGNGLTAIFFLDFVWGAVGFFNVGGQPIVARCASAARRSVAFDHAILRKIVDGVEI